MSRTLIVIALAITFLGVTLTRSHAAPGPAPTQTEAERKADEARHEAAMQKAEAAHDERVRLAQIKHGKEMVAELRFYRHPTAHDLCLAYGYEEKTGGDSSTGGPIMFPVDCEKVADLIVDK